MIFAARQVQKQNREIFTAFIDLIKTFDSRADLWKIVTKFGLPDEFLALARLSHEGIQASVSIDG